MSKPDTPENDAGTVRVGFRYRDGEVLAPEQEVKSQDDEIPAVVFDLGDGEWITLPELRRMHDEQLERDLASWEDAPLPPGDGEAS